MDKDSFEITLMGAHKANGAKDKRPIADQRRLQDSIAALAERI
jgi:hypothetical protein